MGVCGLSRSMHALHAAQVLHPEVVSSLCGYRGRELSFQLVPGRYIVFNAVRYFFTFGISLAPVKAIVHGRTE